MSRPAAELRAFFAAVQFLTRVPIPSGSTGDTWREDLRRCPRYFPVVGGLVGLATGLVYALLSLWLPPLLSAALALAFEAFITGAFHEDAFADYCDAMGGAVTRERTLEILKDSRVGSYGALGLALGVLIRAAALASLAAPFSIAASAAAGAFARFCAVAAMAAAPPVSRESLVKDIGARPASGCLVIAALGMAIFSVSVAYLAPGQTVVACAVCALIVVFFVRQMMRKVGGVFGDGLGAIAFVVQAAALAIYAGRW
jgi:adenosylcobinamide-GDP ribazoletransferase